MSDVEIDEFLEGVAVSKVLGRSVRRVELLEYIIRTEAKGEGDKLKAYAIGLDVFGKDEDFDPTSDSIVRVEIGRLRTALALFEASEFATTTLRVDIPVGTYRPTFSKRTLLADGGNTSVPAAKDAPEPQSPDDDARPPRARRRVPAVLLIAAVILFAVVGLVWFDPVDNQEDQSFSQYPITLNVNEFTGIGLATNITQLIKAGFSGNSIVKLLEVEEIRPGSTHFVIKGHVSNYNNEPLVHVELTNTDVNRVVWIRTFGLPEGMGLEEAIDLTVIGELQTRLLGSAKETLENKELAELSAEELFLLATWVSGPAVSSAKWETERVAMMILALEKKPDYGLAHSVLADKYSFLANVYEPWDTPENRDLAVFHAQRAVELSPLDANAMFNVAQSLWHAGRMKESQRIFQRVTELDGGNSLARLFSVVVPFWCDDVPDDVMNFAIDFDDQLSPDDPIRWIVLTWIATLHTNRGEYDLALEAATDASRIFQVGYTYMAHAMLLNKAGRTMDAIHVIKRQQYNWPGVRPKHYSEVTVPRQCHERLDAKVFEANYQDLTDSTLGKIE